MTRPFVKNVLIDFLLYAVVAVLIGFLWDDGLNFSAWHLEWRTVLPTFCVAGEE